MLVSPQPQAEAAKNSAGSPLMFGLFSGAGMSVYNCSLHVVRVEASIECESQRCVAGSPVIEDTLYNFLQSCGELPVSFQSGTNILSTVMATLAVFRGQ
jgi:hypothetical protein